MVLYEYCSGSQPRVDLILIPVILFELSFLEVEGYMFGEGQVTFSFQRDSNYFQGKGGSRDASP
jgi:hypothetical protein